MPPQEKMQQIKKNYSYSIRNPGPGVKFVYRWRRQNAQQHQPCPGERHIPTGTYLGPRPSRSWPIPSPTSGQPSPPLTRMPLFSHPHSSPLTLQTLPISRLPSPHYSPIPSSAISFSPLTPNVSPAPRLRPLPFLRKYFLPLLLLTPSSLS